jgi:hypothetical protein
MMIEVNSHSEGVLKRDVTDTPQVFAGMKKPTGACASVGLKRFGRHQVWRPDSVGQCPGAWRQTISAASLLR